MQEANRNGKARVLFVDDEKRVLNSVRGMFRRDFELFLTTQGSAAVKIATQTPIDVIVADQRMPGMSGVEVLGKVKELSPHTIRILLTGYADPGAVTGSINVGEVFRFLAKPCPPQVLRETLELAVSANRAQGTAFSGAATDSRDSNEAPAIEPAAKIRVPARGTMVLRPARRHRNGTAEPAQTAGRSTSLLSRLTSIGKPEFGWDRPHGRLPSTELSGRDVGAVVYTVDSAFAEIALRALSRERSTSLATSLIKVMNAVEKSHCGVLVTDISRDGPRLQKIISALKQLRPELVTVVVSDTRDTTDMVNLINTGQIFRYLQKPVSEEGLRRDIEAAADKSIMLATHPETASRHVVSVPSGAPSPAATIERVLQQSGSR